MIYYILFLFVSFIYPLSDGWHNYSHLNWQTFETDNFIIHFHDGTKRSAGETAKVADTSNCPVIISGGVSSIDDIKKAKELNNNNIEGIIVGKAIYDGEIKLEELVKELDA